MAGPETANNAGAGGAFVPMLALGIPPTAVMALLLSALTIHGVTPGPLLLRQHPEIFWGVIASMYIGNIMLLILNLPLIGIWVKVLKVPPRLLLPLILLACLIGVYAINGNVTDIAIMIIFGVAGYILRKAGYELGASYHGPCPRPVNGDQLPQCPHHVGRKPCNLCRSTDFSYLPDHFSAPSPFHGVLNLQES